MVKLEDHIRQMVSAWPALTPQQFTRLDAAIRELAPPAADAGAA